MAARSFGGRTAGFLILAGTVSLTGGAVAFRQSATEQRVGEQRDGAYLVPTSQTVAPVGRVQTIDGARPKDLAISPDGKTVAVLTQNGARFFDAESGEAKGDVRFAPGPLGLAWTSDSGTVYASMAKGRVARLTPAAGGGWAKAAEIVLDTVGSEDAPPDVAAGTAGRGSREHDPQVAGLALAADGKTLYAALGIRNAVAVVSLPEGKGKRIIPVGIAPYRIALSPDDKTLCVANRGGRHARDGEPTELSAGTAVRVAPSTDAAVSGSVSFLDTATLAVTEVEAGRQPGGVAFSPDGAVCYVAGSDDDTLRALDAKSHRLIRTLPLRSGDRTGYSQIPTSVAVAADGKTVYVACGGANAVAECRVADGTVTRHLPTGWFPIALGRRADGGLIVASSKGFGDRVRNAFRGTNGAYYVHDTKSTIQFIPAALLSVSEAGWESQESAALAVDPAASKKAAPVPVPERTGEPSVFKHVVYIVKENHTYDDTLGDMPEGNGDKSLCLFGENVTPNAHALAREFVLLDNTYTSGTNSADGHQWCMSAAANAYMEQNYSADVRSYPYDGGDPLAYSPRGFLWNAAVAAGRSVRVYGEFVNKPQIIDRTTGKTADPDWGAVWRDYKQGMKRFDIMAHTDSVALRPYLHPRYVGWPTTVPDQWRADLLLADLDSWERGGGKMPDLSILLLPCNHTMGTSPGAPTPRAAVADNDLALGRIVERLSRSPFWKETLVLVIEDDSQISWDHVDGHRTTAFCISPYTRRGAVVHDLYNHASLLKTIERVLGLRAMTRFDNAATPLTACFTTKPDMRPFQTRPSRVALDEMNPPARALRGTPRRLALASARQDWSEADRAEPEVVARAVWSAQRPGLPPPSHAFQARDGEE